MKRCLLSLIVMLATVGFAHADEPRLVQVIGRGDIIDAQWSPSGTHILVQTSVGAWIYDSMLRDAGFIDAQLALYSPDGTSIAGVSGRDITLYAADDLTVLRTLATDADSVRTLAWSPDSASIAVSGISGDTGVNRIWRTDGSEYWRISDTLYRQLAWSEDGTSLAALRAGAAEVDLYIHTEAAVDSAISPAVTFVPDQSETYFTDIRWCTTGELLISIDSRYLVWHDPATDEQRILDIDEWLGDPMAEFPPVTRMSISADCKIGAGSTFKSTSGLATILDLEKREVMTSERITAWGFSTAWSPDGTQAAFSHNHRLYNEIATLRLAERETNTTVFETPVFRRAIERLWWSPTGDLILALGSPGRFAVIDTSSGHVTAQTDAHSITAGAIELSDDGQQIAVAAGSGDVYLYPRGADEPQLIFTGHSEPVTHMAWQPGGTWLATGTGDPDDGTDRTIRLWDTSSTAADISVELPQGNASYRYSVLDMAWTSDGDRLAVTARTGGIRIIDPDYPGVLVAFSKDAGTDYESPRYHCCYPIRRIYWSPDGTRIAGIYFDSGGTYPTLWMPETGIFDHRSIGEDVTQPYSSADGIGVVAWRTDGKWVALQWLRHAHDPFSGPAQPYIQIEGLDPAMRPLIGLPQGMASGGLSPDGTRAFGENGGGIGVLWDAETGDALQLWSIVAGGMLWSGDSSRFAITLRGEVAIYDHDGRRIASIQSDGSPAAWSRDGSTLAIHNNGQIEIWAVE